MKAADQIKDVFITVQKETDAGIVVPGAVVVTTSAAITHQNFMDQNAAMKLLCDAIDTEFGRLRRAQLDEQTPGSVDNRVNPDKGTS